VSNLPVPFLEEYVWRKALDPAHVNAMRLHQEAYQRIVSGDSTVEEEWGEPMTAENMDRWFGNTGARHYPLPKHLHWMGES
jgi:hypothetical protein